MFFFYFSARDADRFVKVLIVFKYVEIIYGKVIKVIANEILCNECSFDYGVFRIIELEHVERLRIRSTGHKQC